PIIRVMTQRLNGKILLKSGTVTSGLVGKGLSCRKTMTGFNLLQGLVSVHLKNGITVLSLTSKPSFSMVISIQRQTILTRFPDSCRLRGHFLGLVSIISQIITSPCCCDLLLQKMCS